MSGYAWLPVLGAALLGLHLASRGRLADALVSIGLHLLGVLVLNTVVVVAVFGLSGKSPRQMPDVALQGMAFFTLALVLGAVALGIRAVRRDTAPAEFSARLAETKRAFLEDLRSGDLSTEAIRDGRLLRRAPVPTASAAPRAQAAPPAPLPDRKAHCRALAGRIPTLRPAALDAQLEALGYVGQLEARRVLGTAACLHVARARELLLGKAGPSDLSGRNHVLLLGPTGSGKTHLVELLFDKVLKVPTLVINAPQFTAAGYQGEDVSAILTRLVERAGGDAEWASCGVVCLDEFDKLAGDRGRGFSRDVGGYGVQRELLHLLSGATAEYRRSLDHDGQPRPATMPLAGITFVACGAFQGLDDGGEVPDVSEFERYGLMPELVGRFTGGVARLEPLGERELMEILERSVLPAAQADARRLGASLKLGAAEKRGIVETVLRRGSGARGLGAEVRRFLSAVS